MATQMTQDLSPSDTIKLDTSTPEAFNLVIGSHQYRLPKGKSEFQQVKQNFKSVWQQLERIDDPASVYGGQAGR